VRLQEADQARSGDEISSGAADPKGKEKKDEQKGGSENRYLFVSARFEESMLPSLPPEPKAYVADPAKKPEEQKAAEEAAKKEKEDYEKKKKELADKVEAGKKRADKLATRFADWYYVISADAFKKLRLDRPSLVKPKEKKAEEKHDEKDGHKHDDDRRIVGCDDARCAGHADETRAGREYETARAVDAGRQVAQLQAALADTNQEELTAASERLQAWANANCDAAGG